MRWWVGKKGGFHKMVSKINLGPQAKRRKNSGGRTTNSWGSFSSFLSKAAGQ
jgi:hypothetical protein